MAAPLEVKDRKIMQLIGQCLTPTILGLLPVEPADQDGILQLMRALANASYGRLARLQEDYPAAVSYGIALAVSKGTTEANFYNAIESQLGVSISLNRRQEFSAAFDAACRALGLVMPDAEEETHSDRNLRPIIFQAGILHYWVAPLADAVISYLEKNPCPDLEDEHQVTKFARLLADRVPPGQARLRRTLESSVGPLVCRAILVAFSSRDFDQLPPHLREPMREARRKTGGESLRSPYLGYRPEDGSLQVVLPKQSSKLANYNTCWVLGSNTYNGLIERVLEVADLPPGKLQIGLSNLRNQFKDQVFTVKLEPDANDPFLIFRADGRRFSPAMRPVIELPLGDYYLVLPPQLETNEEAAFSTKGAFKSARIEVFPGRDDLQIRAESKTYVIRPRLGSDFMIQDPEGRKLESLDGAVLFYGDRLEVEAFTPAGSDSDPRPMEFKIGCPHDPKVRSVTCSCEQSDTRGAYHFYDLSKELVQPFLSSLPPGIHEVQLTAEGRARSFSRTLFYWKGFRRATKSFGYVCEKPPLNFDEASSVGVRQQEKGLQILEDHFGPEVVIGIKSPARSFTLAKPGIWLRLLDQDNFESRPLALGKSIEVNPVAKLLLVVESGDTLPWEIKCQRAKLGVLKPGQAKQTFSLGALLSQFGDSGALTAENPSGQQIQLVSFSRANLARNFTVAAAAHSELYEEVQSFFTAHSKITVEEETKPTIYQASFVIGRSQLDELGVEVTNFAAGGKRAGPQEIQVTEGEFGVDGFPPGAAKMKISANEEDWAVSFEGNQQMLPPGLYFVDFKVKKAGQASWQKLRVADKHGLSESRLVILTRPICDENGCTLARLLNRACEEPNLDTLLNDGPSSIEIPGSELAPLLGGLQEVLLFKYASAVWPGIEWLESALALLCRNGYSSLKKNAAQTFAWTAVAALAKKSESSLSVHSALIFGCQELLLAQDGETFAESEASDNQIRRAFSELGKISGAKTLKAHVNRGAGRGSSLDVGFLGGFANLHAVATGQAEEFKNFNYHQFFENLADKTQELEQREAEVDAEKLLSAEHFLLAIRALNRRFRPLEAVRNLDEIGSRLGQMTSEIQLASAQLDLVSPSVKERAGVPNWLSLSIPIGMAESVLVQTVSDLLMTVAGLGRMAARELLSREQYLKNLNFLLSPETGSVARRTKRLCLLLSLAPELFAFHMLFWEAVLKPLQRK